LPEFKPKKKVKSEEKPKENSNPYDNLEVYISNHLVSFILLQLIKNKQSPSDIFKKHYSKTTIFTLPMLDSTKLKEISLLIKKILMSKI
jgi:hypothetical protein